MVRLSDFTILSMVAVLGCSKCYRNPLTAAKIASVRPGMSMEQVEAILGEPLERSERVYKSMYCPCNPEHTCNNVQRFTFTYTRKEAMPSTYPMLWVYFNGRRRVHEVFVKRYTLGGEDEPIYVATQDLCDTTDAIVPLTARDSTRIEAMRELFK